MGEIGRKIIDVLIEVEIECKMGSSSGELIDLLVELSTKYKVGEIGSKKVYRVIVIDSYINIG